MADFSERLKELRTAKGVSQQELADHFNMHAMTISGYERGIRKPNFDTLDALADYFDVNLDFLLGASDERLAYPRHGEDICRHVGFFPSAETEMWKEGELDREKRPKFKHLAAYYDKIVKAYKEASPDTQAAVRAILHVEEDPDGDR